MFTTSQQVVHLMQIAREMNLEDAVRARASDRRVIASIGPTTTEMLAEYGLTRTSSLRIRNLASW